jgi:hypothetical protein
VTFRRENMRLKPEDVEKVVGAPCEAVLGGYYAIK